MVDVLITHGTVVTQNDDREILSDGAVAITDNTITAVGESAELSDRFEADRVIDATGRAVIPGLVNAHVHVSDILLRGRGGTDRDLYDWLFNIKEPGVAVMGPREHELAAALYCQESLCTGITTVVENGAAIPFGDYDSIREKLGVYDTAGLRHVYARGIRDLPVNREFQRLIDRITAREPSVNHPDQSQRTTSLDARMEEVHHLFEAFHGSANGRQEVWIAPVIIEAMTTQGLVEAYQFAKNNDVMTTIHTAEAPVQSGGALSPVEYLRNIGSLGEHVLLGHCVHIDERDIRILAETDTGVAHNIASNLALGNGFAPIPELRASGVTVGISTDNASLSDSVNLFSDVRMAALVHKGRRQDAGVITGQAAFDMVTIEAARAIRKSDQIGSLEPGKKADVVLIDLDRPHLTPAPDMISALVYQVQGSEVDTVLCDGEIVVEDGDAVHIDTAYPDLREQARTAATEIAAQSGIDSAGNGHSPGV